jgi:hypothetical protein
MISTEKKYNPHKPILEVQGLIVRFALRDGALIAVRNVSFNLFPGRIPGGGRGERLRQIGHLFVDHAPDSHAAGANRCREDAL